jgi:hypothetical protein
MESDGRRRTSSVTVAHPQRALARLLNSARDFAVAVDFIKRAKHYDRAAIEHAALVLGGLISYSRPFKDRDGSELRDTLGQIPIFLDVATDLGVDLELHERIIRLSALAIACSEPLSEPLRRAASLSNSKVHRFSVSPRSGHPLTGQLDLDAFEHISNLMRLACVLILAEMGDPDTRYRAAARRG